MPSTYLAGGLRPTHVDDEHRRLPSAQDRRPRQAGEVRGEAYAVVGCGGPMFTVGWLVETYHAISIDWAVGLVGNFLWLVGGWLVVCWEFDSHNQLSLIGIGRLCFWAV